MRKKGKRPYAVKFADLSLSILSLKHFVCFILNQHMNLPPRMKSKYNYSYWSAACIFSTFYFSPLKYRYTK